LLSPWVVGLFAPDAGTTDIFFWTLSVGGRNRSAPKAPFFIIVLIPALFYLPNVT
jgi:hypothetical protein